MFTSILLAIVFNHSVFSDTVVENTNYIRMYEGRKSVEDSRSPIHVVFYSDTFVKEILFFGAAHKIDKCELATIMSELHDGAKYHQIDSSIWAPYYVEVTKNSFKSIYAIKDKVSILDYFKFITDNISNPTVKDKVSQLLDHVADRL